MKRTKINIATALLLQITTIIHGFILPRLILRYFGSEVNGLVTSIAQFQNYIQLFEGGIGAVIMASLYKPLAEHNDDQISGIMAAAQKFFKQIALIYAFYAVGVAFIYPLIVKTSFDYVYVFTLVLFIALSTVIQYLFAVSYRILLNADKRGYIVSIAQILFLLLSLVLTIVSLYIYPSIHIIKFASVICYIISPLIFNLYVKKNYRIDKYSKPDNKSLSQRWNAFGQNLAFFVHNNTDVVVLTFLSTLSNVSVYSVYSMIVLALKNLIKSISDAIAPSMGKILVSNDKENISKSFDYYETGIGILSCIVFTCCGVLIVPFVKIYTSSINDANYSQPVFAVLLTIAYGLYCYRDSCGNVIYAAGHIKQTSIYAYIEAGINLIISLVLVKPLGLIGIAIGTLSAMFFRTIAMSFYSHKYILHRKYSFWISKFAVFVFSSFLTIVCCRYLIIIHSSTITEWLINGIITSIIATACNLAVLYFFKRESLVGLVKHFMTR